VTQKPHRKEVQRVFISPQNTQADHSLIWLETTLPLQFASEIFAVCVKNGCKHAPHNSRHLVFLLVPYTLYFESFKDPIHSRKFKASTIACNRSCIAERATVESAQRPAIWTAVGATYPAPRSAHGPAYEPAIWTAVGATYPAPRSAHGPAYEPALWATYCATFCATFWAAIRTTITAIRATICAAIRKTIRTTHGSAIKTNICSHKVKRYSG